MRKAIREFVEHYHAERNHQGIGNRLIIPLKTPAKTTGTVQSVRGWEVCSTTTIAKPHDEKPDGRPPFEHDSCLSITLDSPLRTALRYDSDQTPGMLLDVKRLLLLLELSLSAASVLLSLGAPGFGPCWCSQLDESSPSHSSAGFITDTNDEPLDRFGPTPSTPGLTQRVSHSRRTPFFKTITEKDGESLGQNGIWPSGPSGGLFCAQRSFRRDSQ